MGKLFSKKTHLLMVGEAFSGKLTILLQCKLSEIKYIEERLLHVKQIENEKLIITSWDVSPNTAPRESVEPYYNNTDGLIFVVDSSEVSLFEDIKKELTLLLNEKALKKCPLLVFANMQDKDNCLSPIKICEILKLSDIKDRKWTIIGCSSKNAFGLNEGFAWLEQTLKDI